LILSFCAFSSYVFCLFIYFRDPGAEQKFKDISNAYEVSPTGRAEILKFHLSMSSVVGSAHFFQLT
jgi:hypothetical protein